MKRKFLNINKVSFKKLFIYSSLILPILLIIFSTVNEPRNNKNSKLKEDKTQTLIEDAIEPFCLNFGYRLWLQEYHLQFLCQYLTIEHLHQPSFGIYRFPVQLL